MFVIVTGVGTALYGRASAAYLAATGRQIVVLDHDPDRLADVEHAHLVGDATDDQVLQEAGHRVTVLIVIGTPEQLSSLRDHAGAADGVEL